LSKVVTLEDRIQKLESDIKELKTELSITLENFAEIREFLSELNHSVKLQKDKEGLDGLQGFSLLNYENQESRSQSSRKSVIDAKLEKTIDLIFKDYKTQGQRQGE
jgi:hypothetical protein